MRQRVRSWRLVCLLAKYWIWNHRVQTFSANTRRQSNFCTPEFWPQAKELAGAHIRTHITMNYSSPQKCNSFSFKVARAAYWKGGERARSAGTHCRARESECRNSGANDFPCNLARDHHFSSSYCVPLLAALLLLLLYWILSFFVHPTRLNVACSI